MGKKYWVDFENAPHIPVLLPIINLLAEHGYEPVMTARRFSFTEQLVKKHDLPAAFFGQGSGSKSKLGKAMRIMQRVSLLVKHIAPLRSQIEFSLAHASRSMIFASKILGITSVSLEDYEHSNQYHNRLSDFLLVPEPIRKEAFRKKKGQLIHYPGIKENIYLEGRKLPEKVPDFINSSPEKVNLLFRPEGRTAHYRSEESEALQNSLLERFRECPSAHLLIYPRDSIQQEAIAAFLDGGKASFAFPPITDGPNLIASVDLVVGGGGTMTREAALLQIPSFSFFSGKWGDVDDYLVKKGDLVHLKTRADVLSIPVIRKQAPARTPKLKTAGFIAGVLLAIGNPE